MVRNDQRHGDLQRTDDLLNALYAVLSSPRSAEEKVEAALELLEARLSVRLVPPVDRPPSEEERPRMRAGRLKGMGPGGAELVGRSAAFRQVEEAVRRVSDSTATVLIRGESGTGKELVARAIHESSARAGAPFVPLHCAAVADTLLESELFGHERGAFTGAHEQRRGKFELAEGGTLFLDEIGDIPLTTQVKLLRVLQDKTVERVGGSRPVAVDVRVISATHRDLEAMVRAGTFREDLYYRLNVVPISLPPLRARHGDIPILIDHFLERFNRQNRRHVRLAPDLLALMARYHWPGNVRELQNCIERLVVLTDPACRLVTLDTVPVSLRAYFGDMRQVTTAPRVPAGVEPIGQASPLEASLQEIERQRLLEALERTGWVQARTARLLGLTPRQVAYKIRKYGFKGMPRL